MVRRSLRQRKAWVELGFVGIVQLWDWVCELFLVDVGLGFVQLV